MAGMKAVVYHGPRDIRVETIPLPALGEGEILVNVDACAVCGTDLKSYLHGNPKVKPPMVMGHEFTGVVESRSAGISGFSPGDRIVMATSISCGSCLYCRRGWTNLCTDLAPMGFRYPGGMAERTVIPGRAIRNGHVIKVPPGVRPEHAALAEPLSCAVNAAENCSIKKGDVVVVIGAGPMGIMNACVAREFGARKIIVSETNESRRRQAEQFGFDRLVNPAALDLTEVVLGETEGAGADVAIVAAPAAPPQEQAPALVRKRGTVCLFASLPAGMSNISLDSRPIHYNELRIIGTSDSAPHHVKKAVEMIAGNSLPLDGLATHSLPLEDISRAFELMQSGESLRVILRP